VCDGWVCGVYMGCLCVMGVWCVCVCVCVTYCRCDVVYMIMSRNYIFILISTPTRTYICGIPYINAIVSYCIHTMPLRCAGAQYKQAFHFLILIRFSFLILLFYFLFIYFFLCIISQLY
jgi:hypothetical protein